VIDIISSSNVGPNSVFMKKEKETVGPNSVFMKKDCYMNDYCTNYI